MTLPLIDIKKMKIDEKRIEMIPDRLNSLRLKMQKNSIDYYIVPTNDYHMSEYVSDFFKEREFMSGFNGSAGTLLVTADRAFLWTDGRYFIQADRQLNGSGIELCRMGDPGVPTVCDFIRDEIKQGQTVAFCGKLMSLNDGIAFSKMLKEKSASLIYDVDLVSSVWADRPSLVFNEINLFEDDFAGESASSKLSKLEEQLKKTDCHYALVTSLDEIAWFLNLRGNDIPCNPVFLSYLLIGESRILYCNTQSLTIRARQSLNAMNISIQSYEQIYSDIPALSAGKKFLISPVSLNYTLFKLISDKGSCIDSKHYWELLKSRKNETETANLREANITDGVAMVKFLCWLDESLKNPEIRLTELTVSRKLLEFRSMSSEFRDTSFETIAAYGSHGAIVHYEPTEESNAEIERKGFLLIDSGAQYFKGTTDITRTIPAGPLTPEMKLHYTAVLKGNLRLASANFPKGVCGANLDVLARGSLWDLGLDYNHGTGHGIGYYLNVHEGPQNIHWSIGKRYGNSVPLEKGMVFSDEPGFYQEDSHGIRIENDLLVCDGKQTPYGEFLNFEILTLAPISLEPVITELLTADEKRVLNEYHEKVRTLLSPCLDGKELKWLESVTAAI